MRKVLLLLLFIGGICRLSAQIPDLLLASRQQGGSGGQTAIEASNPLVYYDCDKENPSASQGTNDATFTDYGSLGVDMTSIGTGNATINVAGDGIREWEFDGSNDWYRTATNPTELDLDPDTDTFTVMFVLGELGTTGSNNYLIQKGSNGSSVTTTQYGMRFVSSTSVRMNTGGIQPSGNALANSGADTSYVLFLVNNSSTDADQILDDVTGNGWNPGTYTSTNNLRIGSRGSSSDGNGSLLFDGSVRAVAVWDKVLTSQELTDITNQFKVN